ncbi:MAG: dihydrofolate reductase family protein [Pyrinomonadaceae bacterium]
MRKVKYFIANSLDNFIARPGGAVEWLFNDGTNYGMAEFFRSIDTILLGRKTFDFANSQTEKSKRRTRKAKRKGGVGWGMKSYVFSRTLKPEDHDDVTIISEEAGKFVRSLKSQPGKDIWLMGGGQLAGSLLAEDVVDEISLNIHPVLLGRGIPLFTELANQVNLELFASKAHKNGCVQVDYRVKHSELA